MVATQRHPPHADSREAVAIVCWIVKHVNFVLECTNGHIRTWVPCWILVRHVGVNPCCYLWYCIAVTNTWIIRGLIWKGGVCVTNGAKVKRCSFRDVPIKYVVALRDAPALHKREEFVGDIVQSSWPRLNSLLYVNVRLISLSIQIRYEIKMLSQPVIIFR